MQPTTSNIDSLPSFPYHVQNQAGFVNPGDYFIYLFIYLFRFFDQHQPNKMTIKFH